MCDYFIDTPTYGQREFRRRFHMRKCVFERITNALSAHNSFFHQKQDVVGRMGLSVQQKCTCAIRILAFGVTADILDEYLKVADTTIRECILQFVEGVTTIFGPEYLRKPNTQDVTLLLAEGESHGFSGMMGSIYCMHREWKNCPRAWRVMFPGRNKKLPLPWKLLPLVTFGFGMHSSGHRVLAMILMCLINPPILMMFVGEYYPSLLLFRGPRHHPDMKPSQRGPFRPTRLVESHLGPISARYGLSGPLG
ncbi:unnamed protein product [Cuscuta europaea]|uniref:Uncharacterized protein n=1 Tax=Cuscuta europaea TaxID=41803 RepID=A0A9P0ZPB1_CUSEU|nr:unnamed protein product [Cuscuta europaea]